MNLSHLHRSVIKGSAIAIVAVLLGLSGAAGAAADDKKKSSPAPAKPAAPARPATQGPKPAGGAVAGHATGVAGATAHGPTANGAASHGPTANGASHGPTANGASRGPAANGASANSANKGPSANGANKTPGASAGNKGAATMGAAKTGPGASAAHQAIKSPAPKGSNEHVTKTGSAVRTRPNGKISDVHDAKRGMDVHHGLTGGRRVSMERADHSRVVAERGRRGYVERGYNYHGHDFARRSYYYHGRAYDRYYRGYGYRGVYMNVYAPGYYYAPAFYGWAYNPWAAPVAFAWGWGGNPWFGFYGGYFAPYPVYPSAAFWLTDYIISQDLQAAYAARSAGGGEIAVAATQPWTDSGVSVEAGQSYSITGSGAIHYGLSGPHSVSTPAGRFDQGECFPGEIHPKNISPTLPCFSLLGRIGPNGDPFEVGMGTTLTASASGELFLGVNDSDFSDNSGAWMATVVPAAGVGAPPPNGGGQPVLSPDVKQQIADEVRAQLALENQEAGQNAQNQDVDPGSSGIARLVNDVQNGHPHVFVAGGSLDVVDASSEAECAISDGDAVQLSAAPAADATTANVVVLASKGGKECARASTVTVQLADLQEMQNHMRETIDQGLQDLKAKQGTGGLPAAPPSAQAQTAPAQYASVAPPPEANLSTEIQQVDQQGDQSEKEVAAEAAQDGGGTVVATAAAPATVALGQTTGEVEGILGQPVSKALLGAKTIYNYNGMKVVFKDGKVADVQ